MKIILVTEFYDELNNGTTMTAYRLAGALKKRGHEVHVVSSGKLVEKGYCVKSKRYPIASFFADKEGYGFSQADSTVFRQAFAGADIVHFLLPFHFERRALKAACKMGIPCTAAFHLQPENITYVIHTPWEWLSRSIYKYFNLVFYRHFSHIHCPSEFIADRLRENGYRQKLHIISNGVDKDFVPARINRGDGIFRILMTGRLSPEKRQNILLSAVKKSKYAERIQLYLAGKGPCAAALIRQGSSLKNNPVINFYSKSDLLRLIHSCDLYVHASYIEIEAIACIEAFACGLVPVICDSPKSATTKFALDKHCLFKPDDSSDLAQKIDFWIEHPKFKDYMSGQYAKFASQFKISACAAKIEQMFLDAINEHEKMKGKNL